MESGFPIELVPLKAITASAELQSRVKTDEEYQWRFSEAMLRGDQFPPVTLFRDGATLWLADGFHRYGAAKKAQLAAIRAEVRPGTRQDAVIFSAGSNKEFSIQRTTEDIRKAAYMVFATPGWFEKSNSVIAEHVGINVHTVQKYRVLYSQEHGVPAPASFVDRAGRTVGKKTLKADVLAGTAKPKIYRRQRGGPLRADFGGKTVTLGNDPGEAERKLDEQLREFRVSHAARECRIDSKHLAKYFASRGLCLSPARYGAPDSGVSGYTGYGRTVTYSDLAGGETVTTALGRVLMLREAGDPSSRAVVVCRPEPRHHEVIALGRRLGVEFMTPEEFVAAVTPPEGAGNA